MNIQDVKFVNPFSDVTVPMGATTQDESRTASQYTERLDNLKSLSIGIGSRSFHADESGIWLGAAQYQNAPFYVDMEGNLYAASATLAGYASSTDLADIEQSVSDVEQTVTDLEGNVVTKTGSDQAFSGSLNIGASSVKIDGANNRILITEAGVPQVVIGNLS